MINVGIFVPGNNEEHLDMLLAFAKGIKATGTVPHIFDINNYQPVDIAVVFGIGKKDVPVSWARGNIIKMQLARGKNVIVIEKGFVRRDAYYMVGVNGLNNHAEFYNAQSSQSRWDALDIRIKPIRTEGKHIIVCGQVPSDASVQHIDIIGWCAHVTKTIRNLTEKDIIFRPHPLAVDRTPSIIGAKLSTRPIEEDFEDAHAVITYNSNAAVESVIEGIPAYSFEKGSMAWEVTGHNIATIDHPYIPNESIRQQWANNIAFAQWNKEEFECGLPWMHMTSNMFAEDMRMEG